MARVFAHEHLTELARYASVPVINALSDTQHPCQALADILTIQECFGDFNGLRVVFVGDGNNVAASLAQALAHVGANFVSATPPGYELSEDMMAGVAELAAKNGGSIEAYHDPIQAVKQADVIYTDTWVSMGQEAQAAQRERDFQAYQVNADLLRHANRRAIVMHCLPAHRGHEITDDVMDGGQSVVFDQAENRLHAQKAVLATLMG
jgi:ornithine carbamoyltransferase